MPRPFLFLAAVVLVGALAAPVAHGQPAYDTCGDSGTKVRPEKLPAGTGKDLRVTGPCQVTKGKFNYGNVNILANGVLTFADQAIDFWTKGIIIENKGAMIAGSEADPIDSTITIHLYGADQGTVPGGQATRCVTDAICGIPNDVWISNGQYKVDVNGPAQDYFYQYGPLSYDSAGDPIGYFGYKSIGVSYGGTLQLFGRKGATYGANVPVSSSGTSWARLNATIQPTVIPPPPAQPVRAVLTLDRPVDWVVNDKVVMTTTDYLPSHSEELTITAVSTDKTRITVLEPIAWRHQGTKYNLPVTAEQRLKLNMEDVETRAAVALLTRSIRIVSEGNAFDQPLPTTGSDAYFGGHVVARAGFKQFQMQGVELKQLGQGGRIGHYPVHFHMARTVPVDTFVKDNSVNESMTRWYVLHATNGVLFARNVGWKSIGHGFYIEEGSEADNKFQSNIGIYARPAIQNAVVNPRSVPGILAAPFDPVMPENVPFYSDVDHPAVFWIMNGWNDFEYNMAAGAGACGFCYWLVPGANSGHSRHMQFEGYASMQQVHDNTRALDKAATTPLRKFVGNYCSTAMNSFNTVGNTTACFGIDQGDGQNMVSRVPNPLAPPWCDQSNPKDGNNLTAKACANPLNVLADDYYPKVSQGGGRFSTICPKDDMDCSGDLAPRCAVGNLDACMVTVIDRYTSSFHWAETNFSAIWLRPFWYLYSNSVLTDVQNGGITFITGGGYTRSDLIQGHWALARKSVFIGRTQPVPPAGQPAYALESGPFNPRGIPANGTICSGNHCLSANDGVSFPISNFAMNQRLFNIYDGPAYQESNAYLDVFTTPVTDCSLQTAGNAYTCSSSTLAGKVLGMPYDKTNRECYLPNAAIGWKQPNGFYYPPAFHSSNLYFSDNVRIRHYVLQPLFDYGTYKTSLTDVRGSYCNFAFNMFDNWTDIDRQTELSDDDGSLTGYSKTVSVNLDPFFSAPVDAIECRSDSTAKTSPYEYVTSVVYPDCGTDNSCGRAPPAEPIWSRNCTNENCYGVPLYRQSLLKNESSNQKSTGPIKMAGQDRYQRSALTPNNGIFYIDTTVSEAKQRASGQNFINVFEANKTYYLFMLFAKSTTAQTYQFYVGEGFNPDTDVWATRADISGDTKFSPPGEVSWASTGWAKSYSNGVLTVTMNMGFADFLANYNKVFQENCQPASFCTWQANSRLPTGGTCGCNTTGLYANLCGDKSADGSNVCSWAQKTVDCPSGGCYGIGFKTGATFVYDPAVNPRPGQACFPKDAKWNVTYVPAAAGLAGSCTNAPTLPVQFCN